jgi:uncharacterized protein YceK
MVKRFLLLTVSMIAGCASAMNVTEGELYAGPKLVYGGTRLDADLIGHGLYHAVSLEPEKSVNPNPRLDAVLLATSGLLDLPFSLVADTLTLPITCHAAYLRLQETPVLPEKKRPWLDEQPPGMTERMPGADLPNSRRDPSP